VATVAFPDPVIKTTAPNGEPQVHTEDVWKIFKMGDSIVKACRGLSLRIERGEFVCLMGPSGSGKSTLLHILGGLDRPTKGEVFIEGTKLSHLSESQLSLLRHTTVGFIFQSFNLIQLLTALENVELPLAFEDTHPREVRERATALLTRVGLAHRLNHQPTRLSGGEQQRVSIARSLIGRPRLLLADEPTANLDKKTGLEIVALLKNLNEEFGVTLVVATHDPQVAAFAQRVIRMEDGMVISDGVPGAVPSTEQQERRQAEPSTAP
jgi:putative ABC transport system ATP-binding protein